MTGFLILGCVFWRERERERERRVLKNTPSKQKQLDRRLGIVVILSCTGVVLALSQVPVFDRLYLDTLNDIC